MGHGTAIGHQTTRPPYLASPQFYLSSSHWKIIFSPHRQYHQTSTISDDQSPHQPSTPNRTLLLSRALTSQLPLPVSSDSQTRADNLAAHHHHITSNSSSSNSHSPKRKRGLPAISTIPPTPPRSSPAPDYEPASSADMRLSTDIPGVTIVDHNNKSGKKGREEGEQGPGSPRTKVAYNFQGLRLEDAGTVARFELDGPRPRKENGFGGDGAFDDDDMMMDGNGNELVDREEDQQVSRKKVKVVK